MTVESDGSTPTESVIMQIWVEVLEHRDFGLDDNFFAVGGHSMYATLVTYRLRDTFGLDLPLTLIFEYSTVRELAKSVDETRAAAS
jgi:acyl carrier protein